MSPFTRGESKDQIVMNPLFTVIIPLYNRRGYVARAIQSVLDQEHPPFEVIVVDDGSTDDGAELVERTFGSCVRIIAQENQGGAGAPARNTGMHAAVGDWFAFLDADDFWQPNHLLELSELIQECPLAHLVSASSVQRDEGSTEFRDSRQVVSAGYRNYFMEAASDIGCINSSTAAIARGVPEVVGYFDNASSGPDLEYWVRVALHYPVAISQRRTAIYFRGNGGNMERLAADKKGNSTKDKAVANSLGDVSPSLASLERRAKDNPSLFHRLDIQNYINARLDQAIKIHLVGGKPERSKSMARLKFPSTNPRSAALSVISSMPSPLLRRFEIIRKSFKRTAFA